MLRMAWVATLAMSAAAFAQSGGGMACCDKCGEGAEKEMACCGKSGLSKDEIKSRLKAAKRDLKLSDAKIDQIAAALAAAPSAKHECCESKKTAESGKCCE